ncbi:hypothetical protein ACSDQ9_10185 [Aestuariimicrobium soli]|uniref:hypothetical protein n=1 Tax=Aestuariimicrobium soli TaxID=2035834 RepID=UPI003EB93E7F
MSHCDTCDTVGVPSPGTLPWDIDATTTLLVERINAGRMRVLRGDVPPREKWARA